MKFIKRFLPIMLIFMLVLTGCSQTSDEGKKEEATTKTVTDILGREVEIPSESDSIIALGAGALRMVCYMQGTDKVVGVENLESETDIARPYSYIYPELSKLPVVGEGGSNGSVAYQEEIIKAEPDVIIAAYDKDMAEDLTKKTGIPVVTVSYDGIFDENMDKSLKLIGEVIGKQDRADELVTYMDELEKDLNDRTKDIADEDKPTVYTGAVSFRGEHGFEGTYAKYPPFDAINAKNVVDETKKSGALLIDLEKVSTWDPDIIFLNPTNMKLVNEDYKKNPDFYNSLSAVENKKVYSQPSYNWYTTNVEIAIADAYYAGTIIYPEQFKDVKVEEKADEIYEKFLGKKLYSDFVKEGLGFGPITIGE